MWQTRELSHFYRARKSALSSLSAPIWMHCQCWSRKVYPFASKGTQTYLGKETPVMHACGHDAHTAMLMGTAEVLTKLKAQLAGTVMFIFQPAEEGPSMFEPSDDKIWGAKQMIHEGMFKSVKPDAAFAIHVMPGPLGEISYRDGAALAASDTLTIDVIGEQGHGGMPWNTVDPITTSSLIICGLQTIVSRKTDLTASPAVITIGTINGGSRANIVPGSVHMSGTVRTFEQAVREQVQNEITVGAKGIAESQGAHAEITFVKNYDATVNNSQLLERMLPALKRAADGRVTVGTLSGASEDFSEIAKLIPSLYVYLGITPKDQDPKEAAPNHNPNFFVDESALVVGTRVMSTLAADFLTADQ